MKETEHLNKNKYQIYKMMKQHPNMLDILNIYYKKMTTIERKRISKVDAKQTRL
jgi:hypothetical protein